MEYLFKRTSGDPSRIFIKVGETFDLFVRQRVINVLVEVLQLNVEYSLGDNGIITVTANDMGKNAPYAIDGDAYAEGFGTIEAFAASFQQLLTDVRTWYAEFFIEEQIVTFN